MKNRTVALVLAIILAVALLQGCSGDIVATGDLSETIQAQEILIDHLTEEVDALEVQVAKLQAQINVTSGTQQSTSLLSTALVVVESLKDQDMDALSYHVHPNQGVRLSPYGYVNLQNDLVFAAQNIPTLLSTTQVYTWGSFDGTGDPIDLTFSDYYDRFIYDANFANPEMIGNNAIIGTGNTLNNLDQAYPDASFVEFHFSGFESQFEGLDWKSLRLIFREAGSTWYLVGIVHDEWTI